MVIFLWERPYKGPQRPWGVPPPHGECREVC